MKVICSSPAMMEVLAVLQSAKQSGLPLLVQGETGAGKTFLVEETFRGNEPPLVKVECTNFTESLGGSELFGYRRGAFTGANEDREGLVHLADGGILYLDEIGDLSLPLQAKLLRLIDEGKFRRVGDTEEQAVKIRCVASTNRSLDEMIDNGEFRLDLYHRLRGHFVQIPPLRDRAQEIPQLVKVILEAESISSGQPEKEISPEAMGALQTYQWPGNVRELKLLMLTVARMSENPITYQTIKKQLESKLRPDNVISIRKNGANHDASEEQPLEDNRVAEEVAHYHFKQLLSTFVDDDQIESAWPDFWDRHRKYILSAHTLTIRHSVIDACLQEESLRGSKLAITASLRRTGGNVGLTALYTGVSKSSVRRALDAVIAADPFK